MKYNKLLGVVRMHIYMYIYISRYLYVRIRTLYTCIVYQYICIYGKYIIVYIDTIKYSYKIQTILNKFDFILFTARK